MNFAIWRAKSNGITVRVQQFLFPAVTEARPKDRSGVLCTVTVIPGNPYDSAKAESFMKTLKAEQINGKAFADLGDARRHINSFIAEVYNKERLHSALGYQSPLEFETAFAQNNAR
jgi:hypothetical protein